MLLFSPNSLLQHVQNEAILALYDHVASASPQLVICTILDYITNHLLMHVTRCHFCLELHTDLLIALINGP